MMFTFFHSPGRAPTPSRASHTPVTHSSRAPPGPSSAQFARNVKHCDQKLARGAGPSHPYNRTLRRQGSLKAQPSLRKGTSRPTDLNARRGGLMPGGIQSVASMAAIPEGNTSVPVAEPSTAPATVTTPAWMPGGLQPVAMPSFMEANATFVLPGSEPVFCRPSEQVAHAITEDEDKIFRRQMASMMRVHHFKKGLMEHRDEMERIIAEKKKEAKMERKMRAQQERERLEREELARQEAERLELERLGREEAQRAEIERLHQERIAREAAEREAHRQEQERQRLAREAEAKARAEQERLAREAEAKARAELERLEMLAAMQAERERAEKEAAELLQAKFSLYETKWKELKDGLSADFRKLHAVELPWPVFCDVSGPADITEARVAEFLLHPARPEVQGKTYRLVLKMEVVRWHSDRFDTKVLPIVEEQEQEKTAEIAGHVTRILTTFLMNIN